LQRCLVEHAHAVHNQRGLPLLVPYSWNVRNLQAHAYACGVCRAVGTDRHQLSVQRAEISHVLALDKNMMAAALRCRDAWWNVFMPFTTNEANHFGFLIRGMCEASLTGTTCACKRGNEWKLHIYLLSIGNMVAAAGPLIKCGAVATLWQHCRNLL
jgi:hypothetical protein